MLKIVEFAEVSKETHPDLFRGIEAIAKEFPNGWSATITTGDTVFLEIKLTAPAGNSRRTPSKKGPWRPESIRAIEERGIGNSTCL
jgi:hypothetical protein